ncbi:MAG TPA: hypothetical protein VN775_07570, partial [Opitutaceae bacterium]|nr:hypothetical protein [Opitutaceae bacterium]
AAKVYAAHGDMAAARDRLADFPAELRARIEREPANARLHSYLAEMEALLGHNEEAVRLARQAVGFLPETRDTIDAPTLSFILAQVYAWTGDKERALAELARLLAIPSPADVHSLRHDPMLTALRGEPRFEALLKDPRNTAQMF